MVFKDLGRIAYREALSLQEATVEAVAGGTQPETVYLLEHPPVFTRGRGVGAQGPLSLCDREQKSIPVIDTNRGGNITFHGPGQLVGYPHLDLRRRGRDLHGYLRALEKALILTATALGVPAFQREGLTGVWTRAGKLASIGVGVRHWVTMHGLALNVNTDLRYFQLIDPCGIQNCPVTSLNSELGAQMDMAEVKVSLRESFEEVLGEMVTSPQQSF